MQNGRGPAPCPPTTNTTNHNLRVVQVFYGRDLDAPSCVNHQPWAGAAGRIPAIATIVNDDTHRSVEWCVHCCRAELGFVPQAINGQMYFGRDTRYLLTHEQRLAIEEIPIEVMAAELRRAPVVVMPRKPVSHRLSSSVGRSSGARA